jgi:hypothetical protein
VIEDSEGEDEAEGDYVNIDSLLDDNETPASKSKNINNEDFLEEDSSEGGSDEEEDER